MTQLEIAFNEKIIDKCEQIAQIKTTRECKILLTKVQHSVCRMTGEMVDCDQLEIAAIFPLATMDEAHVREKLENDDFKSSMRTYIYKMKGAADELDVVLKSIITDELLHHFNWSGSWV